jgi:hypothetical protein
MRKLLTVKCGCNSDYYVSMELTTLKLTCKQCNEAILVIRSLRAHHIEEKDFLNTLKSMRREHETRGLY